MSEITYGGGDDFPLDDISFDGRNSGGGYEPILNDLLTSSKGYPHTIVNEGIGGDKSIDGMNLMPSILAKHPSAEKFLLLYGTNDSHGTGVPCGAGLNPGDTGYADSYKDHMDKMIKTIINAGKEPILAKVPMALGSCSTCTPFSDPYTANRNLLISEYNKVIDELVAGNGLITPPDFYNELPHSEYADNLHPNGAGYITMATSWFNALLGWH